MDVGEVEGDVVCSAGLGGCIEDRAEGDSVWGFRLRHIYPPELIAGPQTVPRMRHERDMHRIE